MSEERTIYRVRTQAAERQRRYRERQAEKGRQAVTVTVSAEAGEAVRAIAKRTRAGEPLADVLRDLAPAKSGIFGRFGR